MSYFRTKFDTQINIYQTVQSNLTGFKSQFTQIPVPSTGNKITGFQFDKSFWKNDTEDNSLFSVPTNWDASSNNIESLFQPGIGDNKDLEVQKVIINIDNNQVPWHPELFHGYFYTGKDEYYLYSDDSLTHYPEHERVIINNTISGGNYFYLEFPPKPSIPILARTFRWNEDAGSWVIHQSANKKVEFTPSEPDLLTQAGDLFLWENMNTAEQEFILVYSGVTPQVVFNQQVVTRVGRPLLNPTVSGYNSDELEAMELVGFTTDQDFQEHNLLFSPVDRTSDIQVILENGSDVQEQTIVEEFTSGGSGEVIVDWDLGILRFGSIDSGGRPSVGYSIYSFYYKTIALEYEPEHLRDIASSLEANINPVTRYNADGFVILRNSTEDIGSIVLSAELPVIGNNYVGPLYIGSSFSRLIATVLSTTGNPIEGLRVFFEIIIGSDVISFSGDSEASAFTNVNGQAFTLINPPLTVNSIGGVTDQVTYPSSGNSQLFLDDYTPPDNNSELFLFQVHTTDHILGIPKSDLLSYWETYIQEQATISGQTKGPLINWDLGLSGDYSWLSGAFEDFIKWELLHRTLFSLPNPTTYEPDELRVGKKTVIAVLDSNAVNPHTGTTPAYMPLQPESYQVTSSGTRINFDVAIPATGSLYKSYIVVGPELVTVRAHVINPRSGEILVSNDLSILIDIPDSSTGIYNIDAINSVPSGLLNSAPLLDQDGTALTNTVLTATGLTPIGWRIRSPGITIASALDAITFLDINPITQV